MRFEDINVACWSGARGHGFDSRVGPSFLFNYYSLQQEFIILLVEIPIVFSTFPTH